MKRPITHVIGDAGAKAVAKEFVAYGWACDPVLSDYGEDLIIQTTLNDTVDPFRTLVQVRSSRGVNTDGRLTCRIGREHALRWLRTAEPVLLVLWDVRADRGWYTFPVEQFSEIDLLLNRKNSVLVEFSDSNTFEKTRGPRLAWELRLNYFRQRMLSAEERDRRHDLELTEGLAPGGKHKSLLGVVVFEFLRLIGLITPRGLSTRSRKMFANAKRTMARDHYRKPLSAADRDNLEREAALLVLVAQVNQSTGVGVPAFVAETAAFYLLFLLKRTAKPRRPTLTG